MSLLANKLEYITLRGAILDSFSMKISLCALCAFMKQELWSYIHISNLKPLVTSVITVVN